MNRFSAPFILSDLSFFKPICASCSQCHTSCHASCEQEGFRNVWKKNHVSGSLLSRCCSRCIWACHPDVRVSPNGSLLGWCRPKHFDDEPVSTAWSCSLECVAACCLLALLVAGTVARSPLCFKPTDRSATDRDKTSTVSSCQTLSADCPWTRRFLCIHSFYSIHFHTGLLLRLERYLQLNYYCSGFSRALKFYTEQEERKKNMCTTFRFFWYLLYVRISALQSAWHTGHAFHRGVCRKSVMKTVSRVRWKHLLYKTVSFYRIRWIKNRIYVAQLCCSNVFLPVYKTFGARGSCCWMLRV